MVEVPPPAFKPALFGAAEFAQIVYLDQRGQGRSDRRTADEWTWERWADDVVEFCEILDVIDPILVGTSSGGWVALQAARRHPDKVGKLVVDSTMPSPFEERLDNFERLGGRRAREIARRFMTGETGDEINKAWREVCLPLYRRKRDPIEAEHMLKRFIFSQEVADHSRQVLFSEYGVLDGLQTIRCPTLILAGGEDPVASPEAARKLADSLVNAQVQLEVLPDTGHGVFREAPERALTLIKDFVTR